MFCNFCEKLENSKWSPFLARQNFFENWHGYSADIPYGSKISSKSLYLAGFSRYKHFYVLRHFWRDKIFLKIGMATLQIYPVGQKFRRISHGYLAGFSRYKHFYVLQFLRKIRKFKMAAIFGETKFFSKLG